MYPSNFHNNLLQKRLTRELLSIQTDPPPGVKVNPGSIGSSLTQ